MSGSVQTSSQVSALALPPVLAPPSSPSNDAGKSFALILSEVNSGSPGHATKSAERDHSGSAQTPPNSNGGGGNGDNPGPVTSAFRHLFGHVDPNQWAAQGVAAGGAAGAVVGGVVGGASEGVAGAGTGTLAAPGVGTVGGGIAGAVAGFAQGAAVAGAAGAVAGGVIGRAAGEFVVYMAWGNGDPVSVDKGQQDRHIEGTKNYDPTRSALKADPRELLNTYSGKGQPVGPAARGTPGFREQFDTKTQEIGTYRDLRTGTESPTTRGTIHYSSKGAHIVPARPSPVGEN